MLNDFMFIPSYKYISSYRHEKFVTVKSLKLIFILFKNQVSIWQSIQNLQ